jgi:hypothetical protein
MKGIIRISDLREENKKNADKKDEEKTAQDSPYIDESVNILTDMIKEPVASASAN